MLKFMMTEKSVAEILTVQEVAAYLRVNPVTIYRMVAKKTIPFVRPGDSFKIRFVKSVIDEWLERSRV